ncbi:class I SAM-dependent methyltransferase [Flagellimonas maritima]|nr:class I SAM-dependent methyltransferase [Allomuricauda aurantiaca]
MEDIIGNALLDYQAGKHTEDITTYSSLDEVDSILLPYLFRSFDEMPRLEQKALELAKGNVLDIGCGAGSHTLYLQNKGLNVSALDSSKGAMKVCEKRGVKKMIHSKILDFEYFKFDTLLLLMNGIGLAGKIIDLGYFLKHLKTLLNPNGQILLDSSDIIYMFDKDEDGGFWVPDTGSYYGEVTFTMEYKGQKSSPFEWLYIDFNTLKKVCKSNGFNCELVSKGKHYDYLAKLSLSV